MLSTCRSEGEPARATESLGFADLARVVERYVSAYHARDLDAMLALMDENVVCRPTPLFGRGPYVGHDGVRAWWRAMTADPEESYDVVIREVHQIGSNRVAALGEIWSRRRPLSPWAVLLRVDNGLIAESRSYLSDKELLGELGLLGEKPMAISRVPPTVQC